MSNENRAPAMFTLPMGSGSARIGGVRSECMDLENPIYRGDALVYVREGSLGISYTGKDGRRAGVRVWVDDDEGQMVVIAQGVEVATVKLQEAPHGE